MHTGILILKICFLVVLVATNPTSQKILIPTYSGAHCDQVGYRKTITDTVKYEDRSENTIPSILKPNQIASIYQTGQENYLQNNILKLFYNKIFSDPVTIDVINDVKQDSNAAVIHHGQISSNIPNVVNNYIILPPDFLYNDRKAIKEDDCPERTFTSPNFCTRVKKNANEYTFDTSKSDTGTNFMVKETIHTNKKNSRYVQEKSDNENKYVKKPLKKISQKINKSVPNKTLEEKNTNFNEFSMNENKIQELYQNENSAKLTNKLNKKKKSRTKNQISANTFKTSNEVVEKKQLNHNLKKNIGSKKINKISKKYDNKSNDQPKKIRTDEIMRKNQLQEKNPVHYKGKQTNTGNRNRDEKKNYHKNFPFGPSYQMPNMPHDDDMYKYMNAILSNYQLPNTQFSKGSPFDYNNIYQFSQSPFPWNNINTRKTKSKLHRRRKQRNDYKKRLNKKKLYTRKKQSEKKLITGAIIENQNFHVTTPAIPLKTLITPRFETEEKISDDLKLFENSSIKKKTSFVEESDITMDLDNLPINNNTFIDESLNYNSHPSFIIGMEDDVPIIFENGLIDDYYPDFTADNDVLYNKETLPTKYHGDKYHYVSNQYIDFEDYVKTRKRLAMKNMNKSSNFFFSDNHVNREEPNSTVFKEEKEAKSLFQSPLLLDNPDFRTRKIDSNEKYEPYYHHNTFQDPDEDFNKYYIDDKSVVYSTSSSSKNNKKHKLNDIDDDTKSKWKKVKNSNVETVHARSKLAKYGFIF